MDPLISLIIPFSGYLIGSVSFTRIIGKLVLPGENLERSTVQVEGTNEYFSFRSVSATTIRARAGAKYGMITSILDLLKAAIPITIALNCLDSQAYAYLLSATISARAIYWLALIPEIQEYMNFRRTEAYKKAKKARHERTKKRISKILFKLRIKREDYSHSL